MDQEKPAGTAIEARITAHDREIGQMRSDLRANVDDLRREFHDFGEQINRSIAALSDKVGNSGRPDFRAMASWFSVVVVIVLALASLTGFFGTKAFEVLAESVRNVDTKMQASLQEMGKSVAQELKLSLDATREGLLATEALSKERHSTAMDHLNKLRDFTLTRVHSDLDELLIRRRIRENPQQFTDQPDKH